MSDTLEALAERRRSHDRTVAAWVRGDPRTDPPEGRATAYRVALLLTPEGGTLLDLEGRRDGVGVAEADTVLVTLPSEGELAALERTPEGGRVNYVVHAAERDVPGFARKLLDVEVTASGDGVYRVRYEPFTGGIYREELDGLVSTEG